MLVKVVLGVLALALGIWLGLPGRYEQTHQELDEAMRRPGGRPNKARRHFMVLDWLRNERRGSERRRQRRHFRTAAPRSDDERPSS